MATNMNYAQETMPAEQKLSESWYNLLANHNDSIENWLGNISDKLHSLKNNRLPENKTGGQVPVKGMGDFNEKMNDQLERLGILTNRLQGIYTHLDQII